jgi:hypothetical protein
MHTSEDGQWMWNGTKWVPNTTSSPVSITLQSTISPEHSMHSYLPSSLDQKNGLLRIVPFIGTILLMISFFLPYLNIIGYTISAFDLVFLAFEFLDFGEFFGGGFSELMLFISLFMFALSPVFYFATMAVSIVLLATGRRTMYIGILHLGYFLLLVLTTVLGTIEVFSESISIFSFLSYGFYMASLAPILWLFQNPPKAPL